MNPPTRSRALFRSKPFVISQQRKMILGRTMRLSLQRHSRLGSSKRSGMRCGRIWNKHGDKMKKHATTNKPDKEITAISIAFEALNSLDAQAQRRVIDYLKEKLGLDPAQDDPAP